MYQKEINFVQQSPFIKENIKERFVEVLNLGENKDVRIKNILDIIILVQEKQDFFERELEKIRDNMTNKINLFIKSQPTKVQIIKEIEKNDIEDEDNIDNLIDNI